MPLLSTTEFEPTFPVVPSPVPTYKLLPKLKIFVAILIIGQLILNTYLFLKVRKVQAEVNTGFNNVGNILTPVVCTLDQANIMPLTPEVRGRVCGR